MYVSTVSTYTVKTIRMAPYFVACSMYWHCQNVCASNSTASIPEEPSSCQHCQYKSRMDSKQRYEVNPVFKMYYWRQRACRHCQYKVVWVENLQYRMKGIHPNMLTLSIQVHPVFEMFYSKQRNIKERSSGMKVCWHCRYRFIQYSKCSTQNREILKKGHPEWRFVDTVDTGSSSIRNVLLKTEKY